MFRSEKDSKIADYIHKNLHLERVIYNLALVALKIKDYDKGLKHCQNIFLDKGNFSQINSLNNDPNNMFFKKKKTEYISWMRGKEYDYPCRGLENEKEGGKRCMKCYYMRLLKTCIYAKENNYDYFTTTLSISPYKNAYALNNMGKLLSNKYGVSYLYSDFKKKNGYKRSIELSKIYKLYRQDYCGCNNSKIERENYVKYKESNNG
jgi:predicted adenine nucleotide alpha hydrolase (AANH) superfamily ATPase